MPISALVEIQSQPRTYSKLQGWRSESWPSLSAGPSMGKRIASGVLWWFAFAQNP